MLRKLLTNARTCAASFAILLVSIALQSGILQAQTLTTIEGKDLFINPAGGVFSLDVPSATMKLSYNRYFGEWSIGGSASGINALDLVSKGALTSGWQAGINAQLDGGYDDFVNQLDRRDLIVEPILVSLTSYISDVSVGPECFPNNMLTTDGIDCMFESLKQRVETAHPSGTKREEAMKLLLDWRANALQNAEDESRLETTRTNIFWFVFRGGTQNAEYFADSTSTGTVVEEFGTAIGEVNYHWKHSETLSTDFAVYGGYDNNVNQISSVDRVQRQFVEGSTPGTVDTLTSTISALSSKPLAGWQGKGSASVAFSNPNVSVRMYCNGGYNMTNEETLWGLGLFFSYNLKVRGQYQPFITVGWNRTGYGKLAESKVQIQVSPAFGF